MNTINVTFYGNGFMIKRTDSTWARRFIENDHGFSYKGIEGDNWPISIYDGELESQETKSISEYISVNVEEEAYANNGVAVCNDVEFINRYLEICMKANYKISVLFCETERHLPKCNIDLDRYGKFKFIGFDYAYTIPDYYSCIFHDIPRINEFKKFSLNEFGLFNTLEEVVEFINLREYIKTKNESSKFELGDFSIYRLWEYLEYMSIE